MKKSLRQAAFAYRKSLTPLEFDVLGHQITTHLTTLLQTFKPCSVGLFHPIQKEPSLLDIMREKSLLGFDWSLPVCNEHTIDEAKLCFARFNVGQNLELGRYNIPIPLHKKWVKPAVLLIPCLGFHRQGIRLGYGSGWYDRTLSKMVPKPITIGIAYSKTEFDAIFVEPHDCLLDYVITECEIIQCSRRGPN
jgi:5-formyltetrahydrofolate cyclo-ligase